MRTVVRWVGLVGLQLVACASTEIASKPQGDDGHCASGSCDAGCASGHCVDAASTGGGGSSGATTSSGGTAGSLLDGGGGTSGGTTNSGGLGGTIIECLAAGQYRCIDGGVEEGQMFATVIPGKSVSCWHSVYDCARGCRTASFYPRDPSWTPRLLCIESVPGDCPDGASCDGSGRLDAAQDAGARDGSRDGG